jgi:agmatine deiminase
MTGAATPRENGLRMPAEWAEHERTLMCWPARASMWQERFAAAKDVHAEVAAAISAFEPVTMVAHPAQADEARAALPAAVEVLPIPIDDSWARDSGPIFVTGEGGRRAGVAFGFNAWGEKFHPYADDAALGARLLEHLGVSAFHAPIVLEGGSIAVDGEGTLVTTEQCLFEAHRNPSLSREALEAALREYLGAERVVWLGLGLAEDADTDGHVDNICAFVAPGRVILQTVADEANPNFAPARENADRLRAAGVDVVELPLLPYADPETVVPYTNFYVCNGAVVVPVMRAETDAEALALIGAEFPGREVVPVSGEVLAHGGGGVHCITQQVPV